MNTFIQSENNLSQNAWREQFLQRTLLISAAVGFVTLLLALFGRPELVFQIVYIIVYVVLVTLITVRLPYIVKAVIFVLIPLVLGFSSLVETDIRGDSLFFFLAFVTFTTLLVGIRAGIVSILIVEVIIIGVGYLFINEKLPITAETFYEVDLWDWGIAGAAHMLISLVIIAAMRALYTNFQETHQRAIAMQQSLSISHKELEDRIAARTQEISRRTKLLNASTIVTHQTAVIQDQDKLLNRAVALISEHFTCYHVGVYLINQRGDYVTMQAASSEGGKRLLERGYRVRVGTEGVIGFVAAEKKPRIVIGAEKSSIFPDNPEFVETRSVLTLPLTAYNKVIGVLDLQSKEVNAFRFDEIDIFQNMTDQIAIAIENARLLTESQLVISQLEAITSENTRQNWKTELSIRKPKYRYSISGVHAVEKLPMPIGKNVLEIPIVLRGEKIGSIALQRKAEFQKWTTQEEAIASEVASQTALALENIRLVERTRERANREQAISNVSARIRETLDLDIVLRTSAREIQKALNLQEAEIRLFPQYRSDDEERPPQAPFS